MHDPTAALQAALVQRLKTNVTRVSSRVYDRVTPNAAFPYLQFGASQVTPDGAQCFDLATCHITLHVWSREVGAVEARRISDDVLQTLNDWTPDLSADGFVCDDLRVTSSQIMADPDGVTSHGVIQIEAQTERQ